MERSLSKHERETLAGMMLARINTRESSTLTFATVTASASLVLLGLVVSVPPKAANYHLWLRLGAYAFAMMGILYREATILTVDMRDYAKLHRLMPQLSPEVNPDFKRGRFSRHFLLRSVFLSSIAATIYVVSTSLKQIEIWPSDSADLIPTIVLVAILFWLVFLPGLCYGSSKAKLVALAGSIPVAIASVIAYWPFNFLQVIPATMRFAIAAVLYVAVSSWWLTEIESGSTGYGWLADK